MCTTIIVGEKATADGSFLVARSADSSSLKAQHFVVHPAVTGQSGIYSTKAHGGANDFTYPLPETGMRYTTVPNWKTQLHGAVGFNEAGLGITGTESIFASDAVLAIDPYNKEKGITEDDIPEVILPRCRTAREGVKLLGEIIETIGAGEGFGVAFVDLTTSGTLKRVRATSGSRSAFRPNAISLRATRGVCRLTIRTPRT